MRGRLLLIFLIALPLFLLASMPVNQLLRVISLPPGLMLDGLEGTLLAGRIRRLAYRGLSFRQIVYRIQPLCLFRLAICYHVQDGDGRLSLQAGYSVWKEVEVGDGRLRLPLGQLKPWMTQLLIQPEGELDLSLRQARFSEGVLKTLDATILWRKAGIQGEPEVLGDFQAELRQTDQGIAVQVSDRPGAHLGVDGKLLLGPQDYRLNMMLEARPALGDGARNALDLLARKTGLNRYAIQRSGRLPRPLPGLPAVASH